MASLAGTTNMGEEAAQRKWRYECVSCANRTNWQMAEGQQPQSA